MGNRVGVLLVGIESAGGWAMKPHPSFGHLPPNGGKATLWEFSVSMENKEIHCEYGVNYGNEKHSFRHHELGGGCPY